MIAKLLLLIVLTGGGFINIGYAMESKIIPFELHNNHIYLQVKVNSNSTLWFILDTGASNTAVSLQQVSQLNLTKTGQIPIGGAGNETIFGALLKDTNLQVSGLENFSIPIQVAIPFDHLKKFDERTADGVLGSEFFNNYVVRIDYQRKELAVFEKSGFDYQGKGEIIPLTFKFNLPHIEARLGFADKSNISGDFVVDLGSRFSVALTRQFSQEKSIYEKVNPKIPLPIGAGISGVSKGYVGRLKEFSLGKTAIKNPIVSLSQDEKGAFATSQYFEGNIGAELLKKFVVYFDYSRKMMILERTTQTDSEQIFDMSGITLVKEGNDYKVFGVMEKSPASETGIQINDVLLNIDGIIATKFALDEIRQKFKIKKNIKLKLKRGEKIVEMRLNLRKLI